MPEDESLQAARAMRRAVLGDAYVEAQVAGANTTAVEFQDFITNMAWGTWAQTQSEAGPKTEAIEHWINILQGATESAADTWFLIGHDAWPSSQRVEPLERVSALLKRVPRISF